MKIIFTHNTLETAIEAAGGLNREYNPAEFDKEVELTKKSTTGSEFYVVEKYNQLEVLYLHQCDIKILNRFQPYGGAVTNSTTVGAIIDGEITEMFTAVSSMSLRSKIAKIQKENPRFLVLNY